jgi:hypothetical protein
VARRLRRFLADFAWGPATAWINDENATAGRSLDLTGLPEGLPRWTVETHA